MKRTTRTLLTYALLGPPIGAVVAFLAILFFVPINSEFSQFGSLREEALEMLKTFYLVLLFSFPLGLIPALLAGGTHIILQDRFHLQRMAIVCAVTAVGIVSAIAFRASLSQFDIDWGSMEVVLILFLSPLVASFAISMHLTRRTQNASERKIQGNSAAHQLLNGGEVVLDEHRKTLGQFCLQLPVTAAASFFFWASLTLFISLVWHGASDKLSNPIPIILIFAVFTVNDWLNIGERKAYLDLHKRELVLTNRSGLQHEKSIRKIPFADILIIRHWRKESEGESAAFIIRLLTSKTINHRLDIDGYTLHTELVDEAPETAEEETDKLATKLSIALCIEYLDIQNSSDLNFALWINTSIKQHQTH